MDKTYLGDSVYCEFDGYGYVLTTENGSSDDPSNTIYLEPAVLYELVHFNLRIQQKYRLNTSEP